MHTAIPVVIAAFFGGLLGGVVMRVGLVDAIRRALRLLEQEDRDARARHRKPKPYSAGDTGPAAEYPLVDVPTPMRQRVPDAAAVLEKVLDEPTAESQEWLRTAPHRGLDATVVLPRQGSGS